MLRSLRILLVGLVTATSATAEVPVTDFTLDNGLQVVVIEDHRAPLVVHMVWYKVGAADETPGHSGIAHFLEHLMFKGTETLAAGELSATVAANGGSDNAFTSSDYTAYFQRVAADRLPLMMQMEADRMLNLRLDPEDVRTERDVILEERAQRTDSSPGALLSEQRRAAQFQNHPYGIPIVGWRHEMETLSREDALSFYQQHYAPNNAILIVAGDVTPEQVRALAEKTYAPLAANPDLAQRQRPAEPPQRAERRLSMTSAAARQPFISRSYLAPERDPGDQRTAAALSILAQLLGGDPATSVLGRDLQFDKQIAVYSRAGYDGVSLDDTTFTLAVVPTQGTDLRTAEEAMDAAIARFMQEGVDPEALERVKRQLRASTIYEQDDVGQLAQRYGAALTSGLTVADVQAWPGILQSITADDVMTAAREVLDPARSVTAWLQREEPTQ